LLNAHVRGTGENSPDLDSFRLFLAKKCNLSLPRSDLSALYADIANKEDDIDPCKVARLCFKHLQRTLQASELVFTASESVADEDISISTQNQGLLYMSGMES